MNIYKVEKIKMPQILENIDKICRDKGRDVLYLEFDKKIFSDPDVNK